MVSKVQMLDAHITLETPLPRTYTSLTHLNLPRSPCPPHPRRPKLARNNSHKDVLQSPPPRLPYRSPQRMARHSRVPPLALAIHHVGKARVDPLLPQHHQSRDRQACSPVLSLQLPIRVRGEPVPHRRASVHGEFRVGDLSTGRYYGSSE